MSHIVFHVLPVLAAMAQNAGNMQQPPVQQLPMAMQPVQSVPAVPVALQPVTPAEEVTQGETVDGFCCYYSPNPNDVCANCQSKNSSAWTSNPANCDKSGGWYCAGIVRLFNADEDVPAVKGRLSTLQMPLGAHSSIAGWAIACGAALSVMVAAVAFVQTRYRWHDYTELGGTKNLLFLSEVQGEQGDSAA